MPKQSELIDEFAELNRKVQLYKPDLDRHEELKKELLGFVKEDHPADEPIIFSTKANQVQISACANQSRLVSILKIWQRVGSTKFLHACTLTLKAARELVPTADDEGLIVTEQVGPRKITAVVALKKTA